MTFHWDYEGKGISKTKAHQRLKLASKSSNFKCNNRLQEQFRGYQLSLRLHSLKRTAKETRPGTLRRGGGRRLTWTGLVSQKPGRREMVRMETGAESKEGMFLPGEAGVTGL